MITDNTLNLRINFNLKNISNVGGTRSQIWLSTTIQRQRVRIFTRQLISPEHWIKSERSQIGGGMAREDNSLGREINNTNKEINKALRRILLFCQDYMQLVNATNLQLSGSNKIELSPNSFKEYIESRIVGIDYLRRFNAEDFINDYISNKERDVNPSTGRRLSSGTIYNHKNAFNRLREYVTSKRLRITWGLFNREFERGFTSWMTDKGYTPNTIATQYSIIKVWLTEAENRGLIEDRAFHHYKTGTHEVENIYLTEDEIKRLYELDLSDLVENGQSKIVETRDLFIVSCWTGLRYSDLGSLPSINIEDEIITLRTHKTNTTVTIPLHPFVKEIYHKYGGTLPKPMDRGKAMTHIRRCARKAGITTPSTLYHTKGGIRVCKTKPKCDFIMNHTARRSFATNMYLKGVPSISIMSVTGHTTEANFMKYIKVDGEHHARIVASAF